MSKIGIKPVLIEVPNYNIVIRVKSDDSNILYIGYASIGSATSAALWRIMRLDSTTKLDIKYADGNDKFDNIYDNRQSLSYS